MSKTLVQQQFGKTAEYYLASAPHAKGDSLAWLLANTAPEPDWRMLDIATGAGHVAYQFAPQVARVWATDVTEEMLGIVSREAEKRGFANVRTAYAKAESLPFEDATFDLVTCRIAPHHFDDVAAFVREVTRVLKPGGTFGLVDNIVPKGPVGDYVNAFEMLRDPSHARELPMDEWRALMTASGLTVTLEDIAAKPMVFDTWAERHPAHVKGFLRALLSEATPDVKAVLKPTEGPKGLSFELAEGMFVAKKG